jgi:hypothetical protein
MCTEQLPPGGYPIAVKYISYTCGLTTLQTRYCSFSPLCCFSYMHFVLICTVVVSYCLVMCVCVCRFCNVCVCMCGFCNVYVCEGFVVCGCLVICSTLTEVFPCFFLSCKAKCQGKTRKDGARPALFHISLYLCCLVVICVVLRIVCV